MNTPNATVSRLISLLNQVAYADNANSRELLADSLAREIAADVGQLQTEVQELRAALEEVLEDLPEHNQPKTIQNATYAQACAALAKVPK